MVVSEINVNRSYTALHEIMHYYSSYLESLYVCLWGASQLVLFAKYIYSDQVEDKMGRACTTLGGVPECIMVYTGEVRRRETTRKTFT
jgi:hypothetical protein